MTAPTTEPMIRNGVNIDQMFGTLDAIKAQPELARGVARGVIHKNTASRKYSRLTKRIVALG